MIGTPENESDGKSLRRQESEVVRMTILGLSILVLLLGGCGQLSHRLSTRTTDPYVPNPLELPPARDDFVWMQVVDAVDDYFRIAREQPVQNSDGIVLDGRLETAYRVGGSIFEPWSKDSTPGFERLQSSLQSIRRRATVNVRPNGAAYTIEVIVQKDLEDTDRSENATESTATRRHDGTLLRNSNGYDDSPQTLGWIPLGRDATLEQVILSDIYGRITKRDGGKLSHK